MPLNADSLGSVTVAHAHFSPEFYALQQEGFLLSTSLAAGLTALRRASGQDKGSYYSAFFSLSIGLERLLKTALIIDHMVDNELSPPELPAVKAYGHRIASLHVQVASIALRRGSTPLAALKDGDLTNEIVVFLDDFARGARYFNLDSLAGAARGEDPLSRWSVVVSRILEEDASPRQREKIRAEAEFVGKLLSDKADVVMSDLDQTPLDLTSALAGPALHEVASRYAALRIFGVLGPLRDLLSHLSSLARPLGSDMVVPKMHEFLAWLPFDRAYALSRKRWP